MFNTYILIAVASFFTAAVANSCSASFSISLMPTITTVNMATCTPQSIAACPTSFDPCCAYICAEAQVPFDVCSPNNRTELASCSLCPTTIVAPFANFSTFTLATTTSAATATALPVLTSLSTSTCTPQSIAACPTSFDPCCAFICAEAQVPFDVCSPTNDTDLAVCSQCPTTIRGPSLNLSTIITPSNTITTPPSLTSLSTSTCSGRLLSTAGCPTPYDPCCAFVCEDAETPYNVCNPNNATGLAVCSRCPAPARRP